MFFIPSFACLLLSGAAHKPLANAATHTHTLVNLHKRLILFWGERTARACRSLLAELRRCYYDCLRERVSAFSLKKEKKKKYTRTGTVYVHWMDGS